MVARAEKPRRPPALPLAGFILRWVAATVLPFWLCLAVGLSLALLGMSSTGAEDVPLALAAIGNFLAFPALLAFGHWRVMRGRMPRPLLWGVLTGGGSVAVVILLAAVFTWRLPWLLWMLWAAEWLRPFGVPTSLLVGIAPFAIIGALAASIMAVLQVAALGMTWRARLCWCAFSMAGGVVASVWMWLWRDLDLLREPIAAAASALFNDRDWTAMPVVTGWLASVVLVHAVPTGVAMHHLLRRHHAAESAALAARFD